MKRVRNIAGMVLRLAVAVGIIVYLLSRMDLSRLGAVLAGTLDNWPWLVAALFLFLLGILIGTVRWKLILDSQAIELAFKRVVSIVFVGQFFNAFMMGSTGGDLIKAVYVARETHHKKTEAISTIAADRIAGLIALLLLALTMLVARYRFFAALPSLRPLVVLMLGMIAATCLVLLLAFRSNLFERWPLLQRLESRSRFGPIARRAYESFFLYRRMPSLLLKLIAISLASHVLVLGGCYALGVSLGIDKPFIDYLSLFPIILSIASLPVTPGGLGVREGVAVFVLGSIGVPAAQALPLSLLAYLVTVWWSLMGGFVFLFYSAASGHAASEEFAGLKEELE